MQFGYEAHFGWLVVWLMFLGSLALAGLLERVLIRRSGGRGDRRRSPRF